MKTERRELLCLVLREELGKCQLLYGYNQRSESQMQLVIRQWVELLEAEADFPGFEQDLRQAFFKYRQEAARIPLPCHILPQLAQARNAWLRLTRMRESEREEPARDPNLGRVYYLAYKKDDEALQRLTEMEMNTQKKQEIDNE